MLKIKLLIALVAVPGIVAVAHLGTDHGRTSIRHAGSTDLYPHQLAVVHVGTKKWLTHPDSARFGEVSAGFVRGGSRVVCGVVDWRDAAGQYVGDRHYVGEIKRDGSYRLVALGDRLGVSDALRAMCDGVGLS